VKTTVRDRIRHRSDEGDIPIDDAVTKAHDIAMADGAETYLDPTTGFVVLTEIALRARGTCCGNGCRHCPYSEEEQQVAGRPQ
jgi:hypothetical protein